MTGLVKIVINKIGSRNTPITSMKNIDNALSLADAIVNRAISSNTRINKVIIANAIINKADINKTVMIVLKAIKYHGQ